MKDGIKKKRMMDGWMNEWVDDGWVMGGWVDGWVECKEAKLCLHAS